MATKIATVTARIQPEIKEKAESILNKLGIPVSVLIDTLYRQIILTESVPYPISVPRIKAIEDMSEEELNEILMKGYEQAQRGEGLPLEEAFEEIKKSLHEKTHN